MSPLDFALLAISLLLALSAGMLWSRLRRQAADPPTNLENGWANLPLQHLTLDIIRQVPKEHQLADLLRQHLAQLFPPGELVVWRFPDQVLLQNGDSLPDLEGVWPWLSRQTQALVFSEEDPLPWEQERRSQHRSLLVAPIVESQSQLAIGGIYFRSQKRGSLGRRELETAKPTAQSLAAVIGAALDQSKTLGADLRLERVNQELRLAGEIQASLIPFEIPRIPGWQLSVTLDPAEETSGDFFDLIPFDDGTVGLVIADVVDKGVGAALYMALSRTLLRTYAIEADADPATVFFATNARMIADTTSNLFVTAFYGVLDPATGMLSYGNAGHNPPYVIRAGDRIIIQELVRTGIPIGVSANADWTTASVQLQPGDRLILYTDGVPDAANQDGKLLTVDPILDVAKQKAELSAEQLQQAILKCIADFVSDAPQVDDITLMVLVRDLIQEAPAQRGEAADSEPGG